MSLTITGATHAGLATRCQLSLETAEGIVDIAPWVVRVPRRFADTNPAKSNSVTAGRRQPDLVFDGVYAAGSETTRAVTLSCVDRDTGQAVPVGSTGLELLIGRYTRARNRGTAAAAHEEKRDRPEEKTLNGADGISTRTGRSEAHLRWQLPRPRPL
ncbi:hypothetical protein BHE74_00047148 [Ensete ventricosum]|nr:hypothetical protein GW17_00013329 [Ensete ventricosum]RWW46902.1 hypothetical protein BHE74_00047148 [Ensete ventricosum]